jgi:tetratricopeptide (TPR) repeat protein
MTKDDRQSTSTDGHLLNWLLGLTIAVVAGSIAWVGWNFIDSLQKHAGKLSSYHATADNTKMDAHPYDLVKKDTEKDVLSGELSPSVALGETLGKAEGSELICIKGTRETDRGHYAEGAQCFSQALAMIPAEAKKKSRWQAINNHVDKKAYTAYTYEQRSFCYLKMGKYFAAVADLTKAIKLRPGYALNYENRAKAYLLIGQKELAAADLNMARSLPSVAISYP